LVLRAPVGALNRKASSSPQRTPRTRRKAHFLVSALVPEPPVVALLALALGAVGARMRAAR